MTEERMRIVFGQSYLESSFLYHWRILAPDAPMPVDEHRFCTERKWRFDFAWPEQMIAVECEGGTWVSGRHTRGQGFEKDCIKYNRATADGWRVFRCTAGMLERDPVAFVEMILRAIEEE